MTDDKLIIKESDLYELYRLLTDATEAAATGDMNACASLASEAKGEVKDIHERCEVVSE